MVRVSIVLLIGSHMCAYMVMKMKHVSAHIRMTDFKGHTYNKHVMFLFAFTRNVYTAVQRVCTSVYAYDFESCGLGECIRRWRGSVLRLPVRIRSHKQATFRHYFVLKRI